MGVDPWKPLHYLKGVDGAGQLSGELASVISKPPVNLDITHQLPIRIKQQLGRKTSLGVKPTIRACR